MCALSDHLLQCTVTYTNIFFSCNIIRSAEGLLLYYYFHSHSCIHRHRHRHIIEAILIVICSFSICSNHLFFCPLFSISLAINRSIDCRNLEFIQLFSSKTIEYELIMSSKVFIFKSKKNMSNEIEFHFEMVTDQENESKTKEILFRFHSSLFPSLEHTFCALFFLSFSSKYE